MNIFLFVFFCNPSSCADSCGRCGYCDCDKFYLDEEQSSLKLWV